MHLTVDGLTLARTQVYPINLLWTAAQERTSSTAALSQKQKLDSGANELSRREYTSSRCERFLSRATLNWF